MPACPKCGARVPLKIALKTTDALMFPAEAPKVCARCRAPLVPTFGSAMKGAALFILLAGIAVFALQLAVRGGFVSGLIAGVAAGLVIALGGAYLGASQLRFRE